MLKRDHTHSSRVRVLLTSGCGRGPGACLAMSVGLESGASVLLTALIAASLIDGGHASEF